MNLKNSVRRGQLQKHIVPRMYVMLLMVILLLFTTAKSYALWMDQSISVIRNHSGGYYYDGTTPKIQSLQLQDWSEPLLNTSLHAFNPAMGTLNHVIYSFGVNVYGQSLQVATVRDDDLFGEVWGKMVYNEVAITILSDGPMSLPADYVPNGSMELADFSLLGPYVSSYAKTYDDGKSLYYDSNSYFSGDRVDDFVGTGTFDFITAWGHGNNTNLMVFTDKTDDDYIKSMGEVWNVEANLFMRYDYDEIVDPPQPPPPPDPIPEPTTMLLLGSGLIGLAGFRRKFRKR